MDNSHIEKKSKIQKPKKLKIVSSSKQTFSGNEAIGSGNTSVRHISK